MEQRFTYQRDSRRFDHKPTDKEAAGINARLAESRHSVTETLEQFIEDSLQHCIAPYEIRSGGGSGLGEGVWRSQQLFVVDIDNKPESVGHVPVTVEDAVQAFRAAGMAPAAVLTSASHTDEWPRFHVLLVSNRPVTEINQARMFLQAVPGLVGQSIGSGIDKSTLKPTQLFYAGKEVVHEELKARVDVDAVLAVTDKAGSIAGTVVPMVNAERHEVTGNEVVEWIRNGEMESLKERLVSQGILPLWRGVTGGGGGMKPRNDWVFWIRGQLGELLLQGPPLIAWDNSPMSGRCPAKPVLISNSGLLYTLYSSVPLDLFFDVPARHCCLFHKDHHPSASIVCHDDHPTAYGPLPQYQYYCHSDKCQLPYRVHDDTGPASADLVDLVGHIRGNGHTDALEFLNRLFGVHTNSAAWKQRKRDAIEWMITELQGDRIDQDYPQLMSCIRPHRDKMILFLRYVLEHLPPISLTGDDRLVFSVSLSTLMGYMEQSGVVGVKKSERLNMRLILLHELGLLGRCADDELPEFVLCKAKKVCRSAHGGSVSRHTSFFVVPEFNPELLAEADRIAGRMKQSKVSRQHLEREVLQRRLGMDRMLEYFPQRPDLPAGNERADKLYESLKAKVVQLLDYAGYCTKDMIIKSLRGYSRQERSIAYGKYIGSVAVELGLSRVTINKRFKQGRDNAEVKSGCHAWVRTQADTDLGSQSSTQQK